MSARRYVVKLTAAEADALGIRRCVCGHYTNQHFDHGWRPCAHCECRRWRPKFTKGKRL